MENTLFRFYYLVSTRNLSNIRYVGITTKTLKKRLQSHLSDIKRDKNSHKHNWIRKELKEGYKIKIKLIFSKLTNKTNAYLIEEALIRSYGLAFKLTNSTKINRFSNKNPKLRTKSVIVLDIKGNYVTKFNSCKETAEYFGVVTGHITNVLKGKKKSVKNHLLVYESDYDITKDYKYERKKVISIFDKRHPRYKEIRERTNTVPIIRINLTTKKEIRFESYASATKALGIPKTGYTNIGKVCRGERKKAYGYGWKFVKI